VSRPAALAWAKPRHELLLLALVALAALSTVDVVNTQDASHFCLSRALAHGRLEVEPCAADSTDVAFYGGYVYSNKAPGLSVLALPAVEAVGLPDATRWVLGGDLRVWLVRLLTSGLALVACAFLVGRVAEGLNRGSGGFVLVTFALGTFATPFAASGFDHVVTAAFAFGAFVLAWSRRPALAGAAAGIAYAVEYEAAAVLVLVGVYVAIRGRRALARYALGAVPGLALSAAYSWVAFDRPWRIPQSYDLFMFPGVRSGGLLGVHAPTLHATRLVFIGDRGLLVATPVVLAAAAGLWLLFRRGLRAEALLCAAVAAAFTVGETGYGDPYGGTSAGPRYLIPALPFLLVGLGPAFARWRVPTALLAAASIVATLTLTLTWASSGDQGNYYRNTVWGELGRTLRHPHGSRLAEELAKNVLGWAGVRPAYAAGLVVLCAAVAFTVSLRREPRRG
jgi:hypothetical protein